VKINHPSVKSSLLKLIATYELDIEFNSEWAFPLRLELFKDTERRGWYRVHVWEEEFFNIEPSFQVGKKRKQPYQSTERLLLERSEQLTGDYRCFKARNEGAALEKVLGDLKKRLAHWTGARAK
jgi:hypothetical protein